MLQADKGIDTMNRRNFRLFPAVIRLREHRRDNPDSGTKWRPINRDLDMSRLHLTSYRDVPNASGILIIEAVLGER